ncbi:phosphomannomutase [Tropicimonas marinistellae]|uniref:phosphomannomutase n=1 Tax=Tropicimonas marinistellae TaxID=1739787 RepID=UPI0008331E25|nr:phosphomannomutase [Tropicimonas marinistellae]
MFTIEHEFDATVITLVDEAPAPIQEDITVNAFEDCVTVEQLDPRSDTVQKITLSLQQLRDLSAALDLPEGIYRLRRGTPEP